MTTERWVADHERYEYTIQRVQKSDRGWTIEFDGAHCFFIPAESPVEPKPGMTMTHFGRGIGYEVRGVLLDGQCVYYRTEEEQKAKNKADTEARHAEQRAEFDKNKASIDARCDALPECFRERLDKFRANNPDFRWKYEGYELYVCEQAVVIADACKTAEGVIAFSKLGWDEQKAKVPGLDGGHSGNTFAAACQLAVDYLRNQDHVRLRHGALAPLVGSEEYGCVPAGASGEEVSNA